MSRSTAPATVGAHGAPWAVSTIVQKEEALQAKRQELEWRLSRLELADNQAAQVVTFAEQVRAGLDNLTYGRRREVVRLLVERMKVAPGRAMVEGVIPLPRDGEGVLRLPTNAPQTPFRKLCPQVGALGRVASQGLLDRLYVPGLLPRLGRRLAPIVAEGRVPLL